MIPPYASCESARLTVVFFETESLPRRDIDRVKRSPMLRVHRIADVGGVGVDSILLENEVVAG